MTDFPYKNPPFNHQRVGLLRAARLKYFAWLFEQGTGKTFTDIVNCAWAYMNGKVDGYLIIAPSGVHRNWVDDEIPLHMPDVVPTEVVLWETGRAPVATQRDLAFIYRQTHGLSVLAMNIDALLTKEGHRAAHTFLTTRKTYMSVDESTDIGEPGTKRTRRVQQLGKLAVARRILSGTAGSETPLKLYSQFAFLHRSILGMPTFKQFKEHIAEWEDRDFTPDQSGRMTKVLKRDPISGKPFYKNLDWLQSRMAPYAMRVLKRDVLDLPPKLYTKRYFTMSDEQRRMYRELKRSYTTTFTDGAMVTAERAITRLLRLQQIACGYVPTDMVLTPIDWDSEDGLGVVEPMRDIEGPNPRLDDLAQFLGSIDAPVLIFARFLRDIDKILGLCDSMSIASARYVGKGRMRDNDRAEARRAFQAGDLKCLVANRAAFRGLTLHRAQHVFYYSQGHSLDDRLQSEDRPHRAGLQHAVLYHDQIAEGTVDELIVRALRNKREVADLVMGDPTIDWI